MKLAKCCEVTCDCLAEYIFVPIYHCLKFICGTLWDMVVYVFEKIATCCKYTYNTCIEPIWLPIWNCVKKTCVMLYRCAVTIYEAVIAPIF